MEEKDLRNKKKDFNKKSEKNEGQVKVFFTEPELKIFMQKNRTNLIAFGHRYCKDSSEIDGEIRELYARFLTGQLFLNEENGNKLKSLLHYFYTSIKNNLIKSAINRGRMIDAENISIIREELDRDQFEIEMNRENVLKFFDELNTLVKEALSPEQYMNLQMWCCGESGAYIAKQLSTTPGNIYTMRHRAIAALRKYPKLQKHWKRLRENRGDTGEWNLLVPP